MISRYLFYFFLVVAYISDVMHQNKATKKLAAALKGCFRAALKGQGFKPESVLQ
jgi:hypothetical protein